MYVHMLMMRKRGRKPIGDKRIEEANKTPLIMESDTKPTSTTPCPSPYYAEAPLYTYPFPPPILPHAAFGIIWVHATLCDK